MTISTPRSEGSPGARGEAAGSVGEALQATLDAVHRVRSRPEARLSLRSAAGDQVTPTDSWLLARLAQVGPLRMSALARWQGVDRSTMTAQVTRLERRGWVRRERDPGDGRALVVVLQPTGQELVDHLRRVGREATDRMVAHWPRRDQEDLARLLGRLVMELDAAAGPRS